MPSFALIGSSCEADGHPASCTEPVSGAVQSSGGSSVSINGTDIYTTDSGDMVFGSHAHQYSDTDGDDVNECHDFQSHTLDPDQTHSVTVNGSTAYLVGDSTTDPGSGGTADITGSSQSSVTL